MDAVSLPLRRWTSDEYMRMVETGIIRSDENVELLDGEIVTMTPQNGPHAAALVVLRDRLVAGLGQGFTVREQAPLALSAQSMPEPDLAVVAGGPWDFLPGHPHTAQLIVEVADTSLRRDRQGKVPLYAAAGIADYWILNLAERVVEVYREPVELETGWGYRLIRICTADDLVAPLVRPDLRLSVADLLPPRP